MDIQEAKQLLNQVRDSANQFFDKASVIEEPHRERWPFPYVNDYWESIDDNLRAESRTIQTRLLEAVRGISAFTKGSPLLTEADQRDLSKCVKSMRAALRLRAFESWDTEVLHDEDIVLGVKPAGQSETAPLSPTKARKVFEEDASRIVGIIELIEVSPSTMSERALAVGSTAAYRPNTAFIMAWLDASLLDITDAVKQCFSEFGIAAVRADDIEHEDVITKRILDEIRTAEFLIADLTGERPSVYYEVGFAHSLGRRVILYRKEGTRIHFDLAAYNCPEYKNIRDLKEKLNRRLEQITNRKLS